MMTTKVREIYIKFGFGLTNYLSVENHLCSTGHIIYLPSQKAADTNITNKGSVSITGINSIWPGWILFPSLAAPMS